MLWDSLRCSAMKILQSLVRRFCQLMFFSKLVWVSCRDFSDSVFVGPVALVDAPSPFGCLCTLCCFLLILIIIKTLVVDIVDIVVVDVADQTWRDCFGCGCVCDSDIVAVISVVVAAVVVVVFVAAVAARCCLRARYGTVVRSLCQDLWQNKHRTTTRAIQHAQGGKRVAGAISKQTPRHNKSGSTCTKWREGCTGISKSATVRWCKRFLQCNYFGEIRVRAHF